MTFGDPIIHAVIQFMGGWPTTGDWLEDEMVWKQKEFERLYAVIKARGSDMIYLPGIIELQNGGAPDVVTIGDGRKMIKAPGRAAP